VILLLIFGSTIHANADDGMGMDMDLQSSEINDEAEKLSMTWPMLPGESLNDTARMFYPKNSAMQQKFVAKTIRLNASNLPNLKADTTFESPNMLTIPTLKSLSIKAKNAAKTHKKSHKKSRLSITLDLEESVEEVKKGFGNIPKALQEQYEYLISKNAFLKEELAKLNAKLDQLQTKFNGLKLIFEKTLHFDVKTKDFKPQDVKPQDVKPEPVTQPAALPQAAPTAMPTQATKEPAAIPTDQSGKKIFKNLNETKALPKQTAQKTVVNTSKPAPAESAEEPSWLDSLNKDMLMAGLGMLGVLGVGSYLLRRYREKMFAEFAKEIPKMDETIADYSTQNFKDTEQPQNNEAEINTDFASFMPVTIQTIAKPDVKNIRGDSTLQEAKLLMSINRHQEAIDHLKKGIENDPKSSIHNWLYLLEVLRKVNQKEEFEVFAEKLHKSFNVEQPEWVDASVALVPQTLEEFPNIMKKLYELWPNESAKEYLRELVNDNRDGERTGFSSAVFAEILSLIAVLDARRF
jgi:tetratricopeptide (TPR) repeat protein